MRYHKREAWGVLDADFVREQEMARGNPRFNTTVEEMILEEAIHQLVRGHSAPIPDEDYKSE